MSPEPKHRGIFTGLFDIIKNADDVTKGYHLELDNK